MLQDPRFRVALLGAWADRCAWCRGSVAVSDLQIDHVVPEHLTGDRLTEALNSLGLDPDYDLQGVYNLAPGCRRCNRMKSGTVPPDAPIIVFFLAQARALAPKVEAAFARLKSAKRVAEALAVINGLGEELLTQDQVDRIVAVSEAAEPEIVAATGRTVTLHPAVLRLANPGAWEIVRDLGHDTVVVKNGGQVGYTSSNLTHVCGYCGSHGPWNGARCLTCGHLDDGS